MEEANRKIEEKMMSNRLKIGRCLLHTFVILSFLLILLVSITSANEEPLTNEAIITPSKAGLSDEAIVSLIKRSHTNFDLNPDSLVKLMQAGVSNIIIEAMLGAGESPFNGVLSTDGKRRSMRIAPSKFI